MIEIHAVKPSIGIVKETLLKEYHEIAKKLVRNDSTKLVWLRLCGDYKRRYFPHMKLKDFMSLLGSKPKHAEPKIKTGKSVIERVFNKLKKSSPSRVAIQLSLF